MDGLALTMSALLVQTAGGCALLVFLAPFAFAFAFPPLLLQRLIAETRNKRLAPGAANRFPDKVDKDPEGTRAVNVEASRSLARLCAQRGVVLVYISTDYVFAGRPGEAPYEADAETGPTNLYGQTKLDGERAVLDEFDRAGRAGFGVVLRVPVLYGPAESNAESAVNVLMDSVYKAQEEGAKIKMDHWALRYPTNTEDVARVCYGRCISISSAAV